MKNDGSAGSGGGRGLYNSRSGREGGAPTPKRQCTRNDFTTQRGDDFLPSLTPSRRRALLRPTNKAFHHFSSPTKLFITLHLQRSFLTTLHLQQSFSPLFISSGAFHSSSPTKLFSSLHLRILTLISSTGWPLRLLFPLPVPLLPLLRFCSPSLLSTSLVTPSSRPPINHHGLRSRA
jgi:hypothetical protein